jgi:two-component system KDP operon response regulator KdpE
MVTRRGQPVRLTHTEYRLLEVLVANAGRLCTHRFLLEGVWGPGHQQKAQYLRVHMAKLRHKLEDDASVPRLLVTEPGSGYRLVLAD